MSFDRRLFSSGVSSIDGLLGGGFARRELVELYGASAVGKTQLAFQATVIAAGQGARVTFIDTEGTFRPERLAAIAKLRGLAPEDVLRLVFWRRATTVSEQMSMFRELEQNERVAETRLIIVDTVGKNFSLEYGGPKGMLERQALLDVYLNALARDAYIHDRAVLLTSRVASVGNEAERREIDIGGGTLRRFVHQVLHLEKEPTGIVVATLVEDTGTGAQPDARKAGCRVTDGGVEQVSASESQ